MELHKYTSFKNGINILKNLEIRFTQPNALNDIYDMFPNFLIEISKETFKIIYNEFTELGYFENMWNDIVQTFYSSMKKYPFFPNKEFADRFFKELFKNHYLRGRPLSEVLYEKIKDRENEFGEKTVQQFIELVNLRMGVLSLSEINDSIKMWGLYADSSRGIVICFDGSHPFFLDVQKVGYVSDRITFNINDAAFKEHPVPQDIFCMKSKDWEYEREYRKFGFFENSKRKLDENDFYGHPIYLFEIPKDTISGVILGNKISQENRGKIKDIILKENYNINLMEAKILTGKYKIIIEKIVQ